MRRTFWRAVCVVFVGSIFCWGEERVEIGSACVMGSRGCLRRYWRCEFDRWLFDGRLRRHDPLWRHVRKHLRVECRLFRLLSLPRHFGVLVLVIGITRGATRLFDRVADHGNHDVIGQSALAWTVIVQNVTKPRLALLHQTRLQNGRCTWVGIVRKAQEF